MRKIINENNSFYFMAIGCFSIGFILSFIFNENYISMFFNGLGWGFNFSQTINNYKKEKKKNEDRI